jgi:hypothetical protein
MIACQRRTLRVLGAIALVLVASACGSDEDGEDAGVTAVASTTVVADTEEPAATTPPEETATPEAVATTSPEASPTPAVLTFSTADAGGGSNTPRSSGPLGIVYADASYAFDPAANRAQAVAFINVGIQERPEASGYITNNFRAPGDGTTPVTAQISSEVSWQGVLAGNGAGGTRAAVTITLSVVSGADTIASETVHTREQRESLLTVGGYDVIGSEQVDLQVALVPGVYQLVLTVTCEAGSGLIGAATHCIFGPSDVYDDGFVEWGERTILFVP